MSIAKRKGTAWEVAVRDYFRGHGFPECERLPTEGAKDRGDLAGLPVVVSCKNYTDYAGHLGTWIDEARKQAVTARKFRSVVVFKRRQRSVEDGYVAMPLNMAAELLDALRFKLAHDEARGAAICDHEEAA